jgi:hypothetical protein
LEDIPDITVGVDSLIVQEQIPCELQSAFLAGIGLSLHFLLVAYNNAQASADMQVMAKLSRALEIDPSAQDTRLLAQLNESADRN